MRMANATSALIDNRAISAEVEESYWDYAKSQLYVVSWHREVAVAVIWKLLKLAELDLE